MTFAEMLQQVSVLAFAFLGIPQTEITPDMQTIMDAVATDAIQFTANRRGITIDSDKLDTYLESNTYLIAQLASAVYNKIGVNGQTSHSENGISRVYDSSAYPADLVSRIIPLVRSYGATESESASV